jgi:glutaredoxin
MENGRRLSMLEVYVKDGCPYCRKQLEALDLNGVPYQVKNVSSDPGALKKAKKEFGADKVPVLVEDGIVKSIGYEGAG